MSIELKDGAVLWDGKEIGRIDFDGKVHLYCTVVDLFDRGFTEEEVINLYLGMPDIYRFLRQHNLSYYFLEVPLLVEGQVPIKDKLDLILEEFRDTWHATFG